MLRGAPAAASRASPLGGVVPSVRQAGARRQAVVTQVRESAHWLQELQRRLPPLPPPLPSYYCNYYYCVTPVCVLRENHRARRSCDRGRREEVGEMPLMKRGETATAAACCGCLTHLSLSRTIHDSQAQQQQQQQEAAQQTELPLAGPEPRRFTVAEGQLKNIASAAFPALMRLGSGAFVSGYKCVCGRVGGGGGRRRRADCGARVVCWHEGPCICCSP